MPTPSITYPLDLTGNALTNRVVNEVHSLTQESRAFVPVGGPFYTRNLEVRSLQTGNLLFPNVQYKALHFYAEAALASRKEVCSVIYITDTSITGDVSITYSVVGGEFSASVTAIQNILNEFDLNNTAVSWAQIIDKPLQFPPTDHLQHINTIYGFDNLIAVVEGIRQAILIGDQNAFQMVYDYIDRAIEEGGGGGASQEDMDQLRNEFTTADANHANSPTAHTKNQVGLSNLQNWTPGTNAEHASGTANRYATTSGVKSVIDPITNQLSGFAVKAFKINTTGLLAGGGDLGNPSGVTELTLNVPKATDAQALAGTSEVLAITPKNLKYVIDNSVPDLSSHINNPNAHTKAQVGLGNVSNFLVGDLTAHQNGTADRYALCSHVKTTLDAAVSTLNSTIKTMGRRDLHTGSTVPANSLGAVGDVYFRI